MIEKNGFVLFGHIVYTPTKEDFCICENGFLVCEDKKVTGVFQTLPERFKGLPLCDCGNRLIFPGLCDTHVHAPQYAFRGLGMDLELIEWLNHHAFVEELKYGDEAYATLAYSQFADALKKSATTRASIFGTIHSRTVHTLMQKLEDTGLCTYVGKVNMDRNAPDGLLDPDVPTTLHETEEWIERSLGGYKRTRPMLTPRFIPSCSEALLEGLGELQKKYQLPVQSHLSENRGEIAWVKELCPQATCYADAYAHHGLLGNGVNTVMAHCVLPTEIEMQVLKERDALVAHCPASNANLCSGIAPIRRYLNEGIRVGLGTDIAGGFELSVFRAMTDAVQFSKLRACMNDMTERPITLSEAFYMGTKGGGTLFGKVGSFEPGYAFDALVLNDQQILAPRTLSVHERVERAIYMEKDLLLEQKYVDGQKILEMR
ncbi:MAG: amidohydrolase family protein [Clostridia bacterium]